VLFDLLERANCWRMVNDPELGGKLNMEGIFDLMLAAGYTREEANRAASRRGWDRMMKDLPA
jgi:hypothetical protein